MKNRSGQALPQQLAAQQHIDDTLDRQVEEFSKLYSIDEWLQPRSMVQVQLAKLKEETRCPMCFGKIRNARISMACLHRYCAKCIEQYLRAKMPGRHGDEKECPVCRAHLHSRRATKPDPAFDKIIKALYGDVDKFDAEEEALIEADNKAHMKAWQEQLADMKARQAAAVAAAKAQPTPAQERRGMSRPSSTAQLDRADADGWEGGGGSGKASKKRSYAAATAQHSTGAWDDDEDEENEEERYAYNGASGGRAAGGGSKSGSKAARVAAGSSRGPGAPSGGKRSTFEDAAGNEGAAARGDTYGAAGADGVPRKKKKPGVSVARLIGLAAQAAAAEGPPARACVVHLIPEQQQEDAAAPSPAAEAAAAGRPDGRSRKQPKSKAKGPEIRQQLQQLLPGQTAAPSIDRPFLACPVACTVAELKKLLLQQLLQQGTTANLKTQFDVQLMQGQQMGLLGGSTNGNEGSSSVLGDAVTVGQLHEKSGCLGPDFQVQYRLVGA